MTASGSISTRPGATAWDSSAWASVRKLPVAPSPSTPRLVMELEWMFVCRLTVLTERAAAEV